MLVVTVEISPGGNPLRKRTLGQMQIANKSDLAAISDYSVLISQEASERLEVEGFEQRLAVEAHARSDGPWKLVYQALAQVFTNALLLRNPALPEHISECRDINRLAQNRGIVRTASAGRRSDENHRDHSVFKPDRPYRFRASAFKQSDIGRYKVWPLRAGRRHRTFFEVCESDRQCSIAPVQIFKLQSYERLVFDNQHMAHERSPMRLQSSASVKVTD